MKLIVGLGNPGEKYKFTRHNVGFILADKLVSDKEAVWSFNKDFNADIARSGKVIYAKPQTFMNDSGSSVSKIINFYKIDPEDLIVIHDDVDLDFAVVRFKKGSGSAGHHGVEDIAEKLKTLQFWRFRVGIGRPASAKFDVEDYVLEQMSADEVEKIINLNSELKISADL